MDFYLQEATVADEPESVYQSLTQSVEQLSSSENDPPADSNSQIKSFDMPSIDDDHEIQHVVVKEEKKDTRLSEITTISQESPVEKRKCPEVLKKSSMEKYHPGIENVVQKLKKHAAAVHDNETKIKEAQAQSLVSESQQRHVEEPRKLQNGLKKLILRSCENSFEKIGTPDHPGVVRSDLRNEESSENGFCPPEASPNNGLNWHISENNNNNVKNVDHKKEARVLPDKNIEVETTLNTPKKNEESLKFVYSETSFFIEDSKTRKDESLKVKTKPRINVDLSGLELLSNSIEQLEHLKPEATNGISEMEQSPSNVKSISQHGENNNNNVDSPLGLLCALAEQRFMEELGDGGNKKSSIDNSEEISQAGKLLLSLGKGSVEQERQPSKKRKYSTSETGMYEGLKRLKTYASRQEELSYQLKEKTNRNINFSEVNRSNLEDKLRSLSVDNPNGDFTDSEIEHFKNYKEAQENEGRSSTESSEFNHHQYTSLEAKLEAKKFIAKKGHADNDDDFPNMDAMELDMRVRLAEIQRKYRENQEELSRLRSKKEDKKSIIRPRNKSQSSRYFLVLELKFTQCVDIGKNVCNVARFNLKLPIAFLVINLCFGNK